MFFGKCPELLFPLSIGSVSAKRVNRSCSSHNLPAVPYPARNDIFLPSIDGYALALDQQGIATLHHQHVLIEFVNVLRGSGGLGTSPKCHLAFSGSIETYPSPPGVA
jgi:hypothetical protein